MKLNKYDLDVYYDRQGQPTPCGDFFSVNELIEFLRKKRDVDFSCKVDYYTAIDDLIEELREI